MGGGGVLEGMVGWWGVAGHFRTWREVPGHSGRARATWWVRGCVAM